MEAAFYAVPIHYIKGLAESGSKTGKLLLKFKTDIGKPIAGILIVNTVANTVGAAVAGWAAGELYGSDFLVVFSGFFTLAILFCSEILPKQAGVVHCRRVATIIAYPLRVIIFFTYPLILVTEHLSRWIKREDGVSLSPQEILSVAAIGTEEGALDHFEGSVITNVIGLDELLVKNVLTPRIVVFRKRETMLISEIRNELSDWNYTRVPLFADEDPDHLTSYVIQRDIYRELLKGNDLPLSDLARPLVTIPELMRVDKALLKMFEEKEHLFAVVDEHGSLAGIITLEDIIEEIVGREIVDEYDAVSDLRTFAKLLRFTRHRKKERQETR